MCDTNRGRFAIVWSIQLVLFALFCLPLASCGFPDRQSRRAETELSPGWPQPNRPFREVSLPVIRTSVPEIPDAEYVNDDELCMTCHETYTQTFQQNVHRGIHNEGQACEACHGPASQHVITRGLEPGMLWNFKRMPPAQAAEICLTCHEDNACAPGANWRTSPHAHAGLSCTACHTGHYNVPPGTPATTDPFARNDRGQVHSLVSFQEDQPELGIAQLRAMSRNMGAVEPDICFQCHGDLQASAMLAGPHQICGPSGFNCTTCHDPHGKILDYSREELCLQCHQQGSPTMAWHSSIHSLMGVACTDCHNPHPSSGVQEFPRATGVSLIHTNVARPVRRAMAVQEPEACYKCHPKVFAETSLPSHHPIREGKMSCSDCHDPHGQREGMLVAESLNLVCYKCHAEKQGPFAYEHPPVTEDCSICHAPHGTVTNNLLKQPTTFLCLRCHAGHRRPHAFGGTGAADTVNIDSRGNLQELRQIRQAFYTDCTQCHSQIHGSDLPTPNRPALMR